MHASPAPFVTAPSAATRAWLKETSPMLRAQLSAAAMLATAATARH